MPPASIGRGRVPKRQKTVKVQSLDRPKHRGVLDATRERVQTQRIEHTDRGQVQERDIAKARAKLPVLYLKIAIDALPLLQPLQRGPLVTETVNQLQRERLPAREHAAVGGALKR